MTVYYVRVIPSNGQPASIYKLDALTLDSALEEADAFRAALPDNSGGSIAIYNKDPRDICVDAFALTTKRGKWQVIEVYNDRRGA